MGIVLASNFDVNAQLPLDSRFIKADLTARDAINSGVRFQGLLCYVVAASKMYQLQGGITNSDWKEAGGGGSAVWVAPEYFAGTGAKTAYTLSGSPTAAVSTFVTVAGVLQQVGSYTVVGTTLTFSEAPPAPYPGVTNNIEVRYSTGAAGVLNPPAFNSVLSATCTGYINDTATYSDVTNLSGTVTVSGLRPVMILIIPDGTTNAATLAYEAATGSTIGSLYRLDKDAGASVVGYSRISSAVAGSTNSLIFQSPGSVSFVDYSPGAGAHTYQLQAKSLYSGHYTYVSNCKLLIYEM